jgi:hypothetical protein
MTDFCPKCFTRNTACEDCTSEKIKQLKDENYALKLELEELKYQTNLMYQRFYNPNYCKVKKV